MAKTQSKNDTSWFFPLVGVSFILFLFVVLFWLFVFGMFFNRCKKEQVFPQDKIPGVSLNIQQAQTYSNMPPGYILQELGGKYRAARSNGRELMDFVDSDGSKQSAFYRAWHQFNYENSVAVTGAWKTVQ
jgi:hypothetical protein